MWLSAVHRPAVRALRHRKQRILSLAYPAFSGLVGSITVLLAKAAYVRLLAFLIAARSTALTAVVLEPSIDLQSSGSSRCGAWRQHRRVRAARALLHHPRHGDLRLHPGICGSSDGWTDMISSAQPFSVYHRAPSVTLAEHGSSQVRSAHRHPGILGVLYHVLDSGRCILL